MEKGLAEKNDKITDLDKDLKETKDQWLEMQALQSTRADTE